MRPNRRGIAARSARVQLGALLLALPFATVSAAERCIDSDVQVTSVLDAALASGDALEDIRIKQGSFLFTSGEIGYFGVVQGNGKTLRISGGWSGAPGQCSTQDGDPSTSLFWGLGQRRVFGISGAPTFNGTVVIENMSFGGGFSDTGSAPACLSVGEQNGGVVAIRVDRVRIEACSVAAGFNSPVVSLVGTGGTILRNTLVAGNDSALSPPVTMAVRGGAGWVINNTFADNTSANTNGYVGISAAGSNGAIVTLANNLFDRNVATVGLRYDIRVANDVRLVNNRFTRVAGVPIEEIGSSSGAAGFGSNDYELARTSTARDAGAYFGPALQGATDAAGQLRVQGSAVDLGAFEFPGVFADGFE